MSISRLAAGILVVPLIFAACGRGTSPAPEQATTAAAPNSQVLMQLRSDWQAQKDMMMKIADAMPENKFSYKSTPPQRSYGEQIMHVASANVDLLKVLGGSAAAPGPGKGLPARGLGLAGNAGDLAVVVAEHLAEQEDGAFGERDRHVDRLLDEHNRGAVAVDGAHDLEQLLDDDRRQTEAELVDHEQSRPGDEGLAEREHLLLATGQVAGLLVPAVP